MIALNNAARLPRDAARVRELVKQIANQPRKPVGRPAAKIWKNPLPPKKLFSPSNPLISHKTAKEMAII
jgi:hypothetical protein